jgi:hypothetical protein
MKLRTSFCLCPVEDDLILLVLLEADGVGHKLALLAVLARGTPGRRVCSPLGGHDAW